MRALIIASIAFAAPASAKDADRICSLFTKFAQDYAASQTEIIKKIAAHQTLANMMYAKEKSERTVMLKGVIDAFTDDTGKFMSSETKKQLEQAKAIFELCGS